MQPKWKRVSSQEKQLDNILTRFQEKLAPLKQKLDEEVKKLEEALIQEKEP